MQCSMKNSSHGEGTYSPHLQSGTEVGILLWPGRESDVLAFKYSCESKAMTTQAPKVQLQSQRRATLFERPASQNATGRVVPVWRAGL